VGERVGPTLGPTLGGYIVDNWNWPWIFYINLPLGLIAAGLVWTYVTDSEHQVRADKVDWLGIALLTVAIGSLQWMLERGERYDWFDSGFVTTLAVVSATAFSWLVWHELHTDEPVINFHLLNNRQLSTGVLMGAVLGFALFGSVFVLPIFLQSLHGLTANQTGLVILPGAIASAVTMAIMGRRLRMLPDGRPVILLGASLFGVCMYLLAFLSLDSGAHDLFWPLILRGVALGMMFIPLNAIALAELAPRDMANGTGLFNLTRQLGGSIGIAVMATTLSHITKSKKALLADHLVATAPDVQARMDVLTHALAAKGASLPVAHQQALMIMDRAVGVQASVLAFSRIYWISGFVLLASMPLMLFWHNGKPRGMVLQDSGH
ncbi:MAG: DHA2 family efflux MFS transporter permease subunit, partial [Gemmatimonadaceae bacterium]